MANNENERKWYDGFFQLGDAITEVSQNKDATANDYVSAVAKTILGTNTDILTNSISGVVGWGEDAIDAGASLVGMLTESLGWENATNNIRNFVERDLYDEQEVARQLLKNGAPLAAFNPTMTGLSQAISTMYTVEEWLNPQKKSNSLLGDTTTGYIQSMGETLAKKGIQAAAGGVPVGDIITGVTVFGAQSEQALREDATFMQAGGSGLINAAAEIMFEKFSGGIKISGRTLDEGLTKLMARSISNVALRNGLRFGLDIVGEAGEEAATEFVGKLGTLLYKDRDEWDDILFSRESLVDYIQAAIGGGLMGGAFNAADAVNSSKKGVDYKSGLTNDEQKVVDKATENLIKQKEADGKKLSTKEKNLLYESVLNQLEEGDIAISDIEDALGKEVFKDYADTIKYEEDILSRYEELGKKEKYTLAEASEFDELGRQKTEIENNSPREELKKQMSEKVFERVKGTKLMNSYVDEARRGESFQADINEYDEAERATIQSAIDAGFLNNTNKTRRFVNWVAKIAAKMGIKVDFTTIEKLKESGFAVDGKFVNGYKTKDGIGLNMQSKKLMETVVGHEITHVLEGTELYKEMQKILYDYADSKGELSTRRKAIENLYKGMDADIDSELTAELVGDYLFTDQEFINRLANDNRNLFQKIWDEVKYMWKQAHPSSPEAQKLEKLKRAFEEAYKSVKDRKTNDNSEKVSFAIDKEQKNDYNMYTTTDEFQREVTQRDKSSFSRSLANKTAGMKNGDYRPLTIYGYEKIYFFEANGYMSGQMVHSGRVEDFIDKENILNDYWINQNGEDSVSWDGALWDEQGRYEDDSVLSGGRRQTSAGTLYEDPLERYTSRYTDRDRETFETKEEIDELVKQLKQIYLYGDDTDSQSNDIAPIKASLEDGVFFGGDTQLSLSENDSKVNTSMNMAEAKRMIETAFKVHGIAEYYDGEYTDADDWLKKVGSDEVEMYIDNDYDLQEKYINSNEDILNEEYSIADVLDAYLEGTLIGKEKQKPKRLDVTVSTKLQDTRFYSPQKINDAKATFELASQKAVGENAMEINRARAEILLFAHNKGAAELLGISQAELNKKLRSWSNYSATAQKISNRINDGVAEENRWTGIENASYISKARITNEDVERLVKAVEGDSKGYQRRYIARVMLAADTHIDYSGLTIKFGSSAQVNSNYNGNHGRVLGFYDDTNRTVEVTDDKPHTVAHEIGHYIDAQWARDLLGSNSSHLSLTGRINKDMVQERLGEDGVNFLNNFKLFVNSLADVNQNRNSYTNDRAEVFARFFARFVEWTDNIATGVKSYSYESNMYNDQFTQAQYVEFAKLLQEKALLDGKIKELGASQNTQFSVSEDVAKADADYIDAVNRGDTETAQRMVDEAAKKAGYTVKGLHATNADFTVFDINKTSDINYHGKGIYFTNSQKDVENNYENYEGPDPWQKIQGRAYELAYEKYGLSYEDTLTSDTEVIDKLNECYDDAIAEFKNTLRRVTAYLKFDNPFILKKGDATNLRGYDISKYDGIIDEQVYEKIGHAGMDENTVHYVVFNPRNIKSADAITYDDNGNVIPLSERFKNDNPDIRFSLSEDTNEATPRDVYFGRIDEVYDKLKGKSSGKSHMVDGYNFFLQRNDFDESAYISITTPKGEKLRQIVDGGNLWKNARLWHEAAKMVANNEHPNVATATTQEEAGEYSEIEGKREETKKTFKEKVSDAKTLGRKAVGYLVDKYQPFEELSLKTGNRELEAKANSLRTSGRAAQHYIGHGADGVRAINDLRQEVEASGLENEFEEYMYDLLTTDRMSLEDRARPVIKKLGDKFKKLRVSQIEAIAKKEITQKTSEKEAQTIRDAKEYLRAIRTRNKPVRGDFYTADIARAHATELEKKYPQFKQWAQDVYANTNFMLDKLVADGELSQEAADRFRELYPHYVPIRRVNKEGKAIDVPLYSNKTGVDAPIKGATGGDGTIGYLFETLAMRAEQTFLAGAKNRLGIELKNTLKAKTTDAEVDVEDIFDEVDTHEDRLKAGEDGQAPTFTVFENGKRVTFEITEDIYEALKPTPDALKGTIPVLSAITKFQRGVLTEYNPFFMLRNAAKDFQDVLINSQHAKETYKNFPEAMRQLYAYENGEEAQYAKEYFENGAEELTYFDGKEKLFDSKNTENPWAKEKDSEAKRILGFIPSKISQASSFVERVPRLAEYIASRKAGASIDVAMLDAARVTTNFAAGGDVTKWANRNFATFLNASVQGAAQAVRNVREAKAQGMQGMLKLGAKVAIAGIPYLILNALLWGDDEEYEELSDYIKENYYIVAKFGDGQFVRIPKGRMAAVIQSAFQQMSNFITGNDEVDFKRFGELMWENIAPNNPLENNIFAPIMNVADNKTWYRDDLVPQRLQDLPAGEQSDETTDLISKWLGETLNVSPYKLNYLLDQYSGVFGDMFLPSITPQAEGGNTSLLGGMIAPLTDQFTTDSVMKNQNVSDFYDTLDNLTASAKSKYATDTDVLRYRYMNTINSELSKLYKAKREAQNSNLSNSKKYETVREIQRQIDLLAEQALNSYDSVRIYGNTATVGGITYKKNSKGEWQKVSSTNSSSSNKIWSDTTVDKFIQDFDLPKVNWD